MSSRGGPANMSSGEEEFHSPEEREDVWTHHKDIGFGGFGVVKLFVNQVRWGTFTLKLEIPVDSFVHPENVGQKAATPSK